ncbi:unnamed protein product, partial [Closterium sp. Yama58-4]
MPLFLSEEELQALEGDVRAVARKAEEQIGSLLRQLETHKAQADAAEINAEQTCSLIEQKYLAVTDENAQLEREKGYLTADLDQKSAELAEIKAQVHRLQLEGIQGDGERERLKAELAEAQTSRRDLVDVIERKNLEIDEKNASLKSYLDKIVSLTDSRTELEGRLRTAEAEASRFKAAVNRHVQEKEILEEHLAWLREDVAGKAGALQEERRARAEGEAELRSQLLGAEHERDDLRAAEARAQARVAELQGMVAQLQQEVKKRAEEEALHESQLAAELETAKKLVELYKESAAEAGERAADLKGVVKSLEDHLKQVEEEGENRVKAVEEAAGKQQQELQRRSLPQGVTGVALASYLVKDGWTVGDTRRCSLETLVLLCAFDLCCIAFPWFHRYLSLNLSLSHFLAVHARVHLATMYENSLTSLLSPPCTPAHVQMATMYEKYEEAADAWRHERQQRRQAETLLNRVLREIEQKAAVVLEEREQHARMARAYDVMQDKLALAADQQAAVEASLAECRAELRARERDVSLLSTDVADLQSQVTVLLKELRDVSMQRANNEATAPPTPPRPSSSDFVSVEQLTITDIGGLVQANTSLRHALRKLQDDYSTLEPRVKARFEEELERRAAANAKEVERVVGMYKEQEELAQRHKAAHDMFKLLYDEQQQRMRALTSGTAAAAPGAADSPTAKGAPALPMLSSPPPDGPDYKTLYTATQEELERLRQDRKQHMDELQEALDAARKVASESRMERMRAEAEAQFSKQQAEALEKTLEEERKVKDAAVARSSEFAASVTAHQRQLRDAERLLAAAEEKATRATIEASVLEREKALLAAAEERATAEAGSALERMHRVQAAHDSLESTQAAREATWAAERKRLEDSIDRMQREWAEASRALEAERDHSRHLVEARDRAAADAEAKLSAAWKDVEQLKQQLSAAVTKAKTAEARCEELQAGVKRLEAVAAAAVAGGAGGGVGGRSLRSASEGEGMEEEDVEERLHKAEEEVQRLKEELEASQGYLAQYKAIGKANEEALERMMQQHSAFKEEAEKERAAAAAAAEELRGRVKEAEKRAADAAAAATGLTEEHERAFADVSRKLEAAAVERDAFRARVEEIEWRVESEAKEASEMRQKWREAQTNYERQVVLQADTIRQLDGVSQTLNAAQAAQREWRSQAEKAEAELASLRAEWETVKGGLEAARAAAEGKAREVEAQNVILLDRLEALRVGTPGKAGGVASPGVGRRRAAASPSPGKGLGTEVVRFLRRSKEASEMELALLKQERLRLTKQVEAAEREAQEAQQQLREERARGVAAAQSEGEFAALKAQVAQVNLLRESNAMLRDESQRNFADAGEWREKARQALQQVGPLQAAVQKREAEVAAGRREVESAREEAGRWQRRVQQLLEKYKAIDVEEYQRLQDQLQVKDVRLIRKRAEQLEQELSEARGALAAAKAAADAAEKDKEAEKERAAAELAGLETQRAALAEEKEKLEKEQATGGEELRKQLETAKENEAKHKTEFAKLRNTAIKFKRNGEQLSKEKEELRQAKEQQSKEAEAVKTKAAELEKRVADLEKKLQTASETSQKRVAELEKKLQEQTAAAGAAARKAEEGKSAAEASGKQQAAVAEGILNSRIQLLQRQLAAEKERRTKNLKSIVDSFQRAKESYETISVRVVAVEDWIKQQRQGKEGPFEEPAVVSELRAASQEYDAVFGAMQKTAEAVPAIVAPVPAEPAGEVQAAPAAGGMEVEDGEQGGAGVSEAVRSGQVGLAGVAGDGAAGEGVEEKEKQGEQGAGVEGEEGAGVGTEGQRQEEAAVGEGEGAGGEGEIGGAGVDAAAANAAAVPATPPRSPTPTPPLTPTGAGESAALVAGEGPNGEGATGEAAGGDSTGADAEGEGEGMGAGNTGGAAEAGAGEEAGGGAGAGAGAGAVAEGPEIHVEGEGEAAQRAAARQARFGAATSPRRGRGARGRGTRVISLVQSAGRGTGSPRGRGRGRGAAGGSQSAPSDGAGGGAPSVHSHSTLSLGFYWRAAMIQYEKRFGAFNLLLRFYGSQWPRATLLALPSAILAGLLSAFIFVDKTQHLFLHPYPYAVFSGVVAFILIFRTNLSYARYWEGRTMLAQMSSKWGDAAIQVISFDEGAKEPVPGGIRFRSEFVHTMSLMHALALQRLRGDSYLSNLTYGRFMDIPPEPPVDADEVEEWNRVRGNKSLVFLRAHRPHLEKYWRALPLAVLGGVNPTECSILEPSRDRVYLVMCWLHRALVARRMAGGISQDAPIVSRIYQVLSDGMLGYENALKIVNTPFPFPFAQCVALLLHINALIIPLLMADWLADPYLASAITFLSVFSFYLLNEVAREIEEPFRFDPNDLPVVYLHHKFNERLVTAFSRSVFPADGLFTHIDEKEMAWLLAKHRPVTVTKGAEEKVGKIAKDCVIDVLAILAGLFSAFILVDRTQHLFLHPYPYAVFSGVLAFILIFRTNLSYARYWEGRTMIAQM